MLGGRMSAQDEDEVEDELAALEAESRPTKLPTKLPEVPDTELPEHERPAPAAQEEEAQPARAPMLAS